MSLLQNICFKYSLWFDDTIMFHTAIASLNSRNIFKTTVLPFTMIVHIVPDKHFFKKIHGREKLRF